MKQLAKEKKIAKEKTRNTTGKPAKGSAANEELHLAAGGENHQIAGADHALLTTNQGVAISDNQNSLRANSHGPTLLENFVQTLPRI